MSSIDSKLRRFEHNVINKAAQERDRLLAEIDEATKNALKETKESYTKSAKEMYAKGMDEVRKEARMIISAAKNDGQSSVVAKRDEIIDSVFRELENRLREFVQSKEYETYFTYKLNEAADAVLAMKAIPRKAEICFAVYDYDHRLKLAETAAQRLMGRGIRVTFQKSEKDTEVMAHLLRDNYDGDMLGTIGKVIDNSMKSDVLKEREQFLSWSNLSL
mgnify:CR=1 FL=1